MRISLTAGAFLLSSLPVSAAQVGFDWTYEMVFKPTERICGGILDCGEDLTSFGSDYHPGSGYVGPGAGVGGIPTISFKDVPVGETPTIDMYYLSSDIRAVRSSSAFTRDELNYITDNVFEVAIYCDNIGCAAWATNGSLHRDMLDGVADLPISGDLADRYLDYLNDEYGRTGMMASNWRNPFETFSQTVNRFSGFLGNDGGTGFRFEVTDDGFTPRYGASETEGGSSDWGLGVNDDEYSLIFGSSDREAGDVDWKLSISKSTTPIPLPAGVWLLGAGLLALRVLTRRRVT